jgi:hypothetical protein
MAGLDRIEPSRGMIATMQLRWHQVDPDTPPKLQQLCYTEGGILNRVWEWRDIPMIKEFSYE